MSEQQWYCPNCGPEISVTVERIHTFSGPDDYIVCTGCGETVDEKAETPAFVLALTTKLTEQEAELVRLRQKIDMLGEIEARYLDYLKWRVIPVLLLVAVVANLVGCKTEAGDSADIYCGAPWPVNGVIDVTHCVHQDGMPEVE